jgi:hypothetical protein
VFQAQKNESRHEYHWIGQKQDTKQGPNSSGEQNRNPQEKKSQQKYRPLSDLTLGEVEDAYNFFEHQLLPAGENWIGRNHFCQIPLKRKRDGRPPMVFGRVKTCYPSDGILDNVDELELHFPHKDGAPDVLHIHKDDISRRSQRQVQSYFVRVSVFASDEEKVELTESEPWLRTSGFYPEFESSLLNLLEMTEGNQSTYPWLYAIGSRWFDTIPDSMHEELKGKLKEMIHWGKQIFNYHPEWLPNEVNTLNRVLGYKYGFTPTVLTEPGNIQEVNLVISKTFDRMIFHSSQQ